MVLKNHFSVFILHYVIVIWPGYKIFSLKNTEVSWNFSAYFDTYLLSSRILSIVTKKSYLFVTAVIAYHILQLLLMILQDIEIGIHQSKCKLWSQTAKSSILLILFVSFENLNKGRLQGFSQDFLSSWPLFWVWPVVYSS